MTKKTNGLLLRYSKNAFWKNKNTGKINYLKAIKLEKQISMELQKNGFMLFKINYGLKKFKVYIFGILKIGKVVQQNIFKFYKKVNNYYQVMEKFGLTKKEILVLLKSFGIKEFRSKNKNLKNISFFTAISNIMYRKYYLWRLKNQLLLFNLILVKLYNTDKLFISIFMKNKVQFLKNIKKQQIRYLNQIRYNLHGKFLLKLLSIKIESLLLWKAKIATKVELKNILIEKGLIFELKQKKLWKKKEFFLTYLVVLGLFYFNSSVIAIKIADLIQKTKKHFVQIRLVLKEIEQQFFVLKNPTKGVRIWVTGKLGGKMRKSKFGFLLGKVQLQRFKNKVSFTKVFSFTKYGIISVKVWLLG